MAKKQAVQEEQSNDSETVRVRQRMEYRLQFVHTSGTVDDCGLVLHYPSELPGVIAYLTGLVESGSLDIGTGGFRFVKMEVM